MVSKVFFCFCFFWSFEKLKRHKCVLVRHLKMNNVWKEEHVKLWIFFCIHSRSWKSCCHCNICTSRCSCYIQFGSRCWLLKAASCSCFLLLSRRTPRFLSTEISWKCTGLMDHPAALQRYCFSLGWIEFFGPVVSSSLKCRQCCGITSLGNFW